MIDADAEGHRPARRERPVGPDTYAVPVSVGNTIAKLAGSCLVAGMLLAGLLFPVAGGFGYLSNRAADAVDNVSAELVEGPG